MVSRHYLRSSFAFFFIPILASSSRIRILYLLRRKGRMTLYKNWNKTKEKIIFIWREKMWKKKIINEIERKLKEGTKP